MNAILVAVLLAASSPPPGISMQDEGTPLSGRTLIIDCSGAGISCSKAANKVTMTVTGGGTTGYATVQDEGTNVTQRTTLNFIGSGVSCVDNAGSTRTDCTVSGGSPGGSNTQVQYNNSSAFGGITNLITDGTDAKFKTQSSSPSGTAGAGILWAEGGSEGPNLPRWTDGKGMVIGVQPYTAESWWGCQSVAQYSGTNFVTTGIVNHNSSTSAPSNYGTLTSQAYSSASRVLRIPQVQDDSTAAVSQRAGWRSAATNNPMRIGYSTDQGGFFFSAVWGISSVNSDSHLMVGVDTTSGLLSGSSDPKTLTNSAGFMCNGADTNISFCTNSATGNATCTSLGASYPCKTAGAYYYTAINGAPGGGSVGYYIRRLDSAASTSGTVSSDIPAADGEAWWHIMMTTGNGTATAVDMRLSSYCIGGRY